MNITQALVDHHGVLRQLFEQSKTNIAVAEDFIRHLTVNHTMEEKYFYDILKGDPQAHNKALEAVNEHECYPLHHRILHLPDPRAGGGDSLYRTLAFAPQIFVPFSERALMKGPFFSTESPEIHGSQSLWAEKGGIKKGKGLR